MKMFLFETGYKNLNCYDLNVFQVKESGRWDTSVLEFMHKELVNKYCKIIVIVST